MYIYVDTYIYVYSLYNREEGCLNMGIQFSREKGKDFYPTSDTEERDYISSPVLLPSSPSASSSGDHPHPSSSSKEPSPGEPSSSSYKEPSSSSSYKEPSASSGEPSSSSSRPPPSSYRYLGLYIGPSSSALAPHTYMCIAVKCVLNNLEKKMTVTKSGVSCLCSRHYISAHFYKLDSLFLVMTIIIVIHHHRHRPHRQILRVYL